MQQKTQQVPGASTDTGTGTETGTGTDADTDIDIMTPAEGSCSSTAVEARPCRRHRRNSDAFIGNKLSRQMSLDASDDDDEGNYSSDDERSSTASTTTSSGRSSGVADRRVLGRSRHHHGLASDSEDVRKITGQLADHMPGSHAAAGANKESLKAKRKHRLISHHHHQSHHGSSPAQEPVPDQSYAQISTWDNEHAARQRPVLGRQFSMNCGPAAHARALGPDSAAQTLQETIRGNTQDEPMSSAKALRIFNTLFPAAMHSQLHRSEHDPSCKQCVSEAIAAAAAAGEEQSDHRVHDVQGGLQMNLGAGRNAVYVAPCERRLECPLENKGKYLIHTNKPKIMTDLSKVEFGICVDGWRRVVFKTVDDPVLAQRELSFHRRINDSQPGHVLRLLDAFEDNHAKHVMVFPRMCATKLFGRDLEVVAVLARQLFTALEELHSLGIAHLDITPTNLMSDPNDPEHIEIIDLGLACDLGADGVLPSRGTCGFVAPEVLHGEAHDLRADVYSAGVVLGMMLKRFLPTVSLRLLGGPMVRPDTTDALAAELDELLDAYGYRPTPAAFVEHDAPTTPAVAAANSHSKPEHARCSRGFSDDEVAFAAVYGGCSSLYGGYGGDSEADDASAGAPRSVSPIAHLLGGPGSPGTHSAARYANTSSSYSVERPGRVPMAVLHAADLLRWTLQHDHQHRPTATQALHHPFLASVNVPRRVPRRRAINGQALQHHQLRPDSGVQSVSGSPGPAHQQFMSSSRGHSALPENGSTHSSESAISSEALLTTPPPTTPAVGSPVPAKSLTLTYSAVAELFFKDTATADVADWEGEMYNRLVPAARCEPARMDLDSSYSTNLWSSDADCLASFYAPSSCNDDLTSYFY
ncbi:hypothetical protein FB645_001446 [Coemansia sp. IMI 203386]|nr:hypothetical protein FB645_001446 [Coemansia sp. IMI 203386]